MPARTRRTSHGIENQQHFFTSPALRIPSSKDVLLASQHTVSTLQYRRRLGASLAALWPQGSTCITPLSTFQLTLRGSFKIRSCAREQEEWTVEVLICGGERDSTLIQSRCSFKLGPESSGEQVLFVVWAASFVPPFHPKSDCMCFPVQSAKENSNSEKFSPKCRSQSAAIVLACSTHAQSTKFRLGSLELKWVLLKNKNITKNSWCYATARLSVLIYKDTTIKNENVLTLP